jgi:hypothetical protein
MAFISDIWTPIECYYCYWAGWPIASERALAAKGFWRSLRFVSIAPQSLATFSIGALGFELPCTLHEKEVPMCIIPHQNRT